MGENVDRIGTGAFVLRRQPSSSSKGTLWNIKATSCKYMLETYVNESGMGATHNLSSGKAWCDLRLAYAVLDRDASWMKRLRCKDCWFWKSGYQCGWALRICCSWLPMFGWRIFGNTGKRWRRCCTIYPRALRTYAGWTNSGWTWGGIL